MPNPLTNVALTGTDYLDAATIQDVYGDNSGENGGGWFEITGGAVFYSCQYAPWQPTGVGRSGYGLSSWTADAPLSAGPGQIPSNAIGVKFKNQDATLPATVNAYIAPPGQPTLGLNGPANVSASTVTSMVTGIIPAAGTVPTAGTGFTYTHTNGTGVYVFTFTPPSPFSATPTIIVTSNGTRAGDFLWSVTAASSAGFTVNTWAASTAVAGDVPFSFAAMVTV